ncbi:acyl-CoA synthetase [Microbacterium sp. GXF6406]
MENQGLGTWIERRRIKSAGETAIVYGDISYTYDEFADRIARFANALQERGVGAGNRVAYVGDNHPDFLTTFFACGSLGAVFVPLNTRLAARELQFQIQDSGAAVLVLHQSQRELARAAAWETAVVHRIVIDGPAELPPVESIDDVLADTPSTVLPSTPVTFDDAAMILYTSGTTGRPKGAVLTHGNLTWNALNVIVDYDVTSTDVSLMIAPMFHVASLSMGALPGLLKGGALVLHERFDPAAVLAAVQEHGVTGLSGVPTTYQMLAEHPAWAETDMSTVRRLTCGGSSIPDRTVDAFEQRGMSFSIGYGLTETAPGATALPARKSAAHVGSAGLAHFFTEVRVVDDAGRPVDAGVSGEIQIAGPNVITEYWNRPDVAAEAWDGAWFRSGDVGHLDDEGYLYISDRLKDMIISGGENIYPAEIEQLIMGLAEVASVAVIGVPDERWGEVPLAVVMPVPGSAITGDEIITHVAPQLAKYKVPKGVVFVDELPRTASGKVRKVDLRAKFTSLPV